MLLPTEEIDADQALLSVGATLISLLETPAGDGLGPVGTVPSTHPAHGPSREGRLRLVRAGPVHAVHPSGRPVE